MKCPICHDLVDRPVTVRPPSTLPSPSPCDLPPPFPPRHRATSLHPSLPVTVRPPSTLPFPSPCDLPPPFPPRHRATSLHPSLPVTVRPPSTLPSPSPCDLPPPFPPRHRATSLHPSLPVTVRPPSTLPSPSPCDLPPPFPPRHRATSLHPSLPVTVRPSSLPSCFHSCARHSFPPPPASLHPFSPRSSILSSCPLNSPFPHLSPPNARQTPCGHNFCLVCFRKWLAQGKRSCAKCRRAVPPDMMKQPRINPVIVAAIRHAKAAAARAAAGGLSTSAPAKPYEPICNEKRPDQAFTTDRAVRKGLSNAASGRIFVTIAGDFFGPITAEYDPERGTGVEVGETWASRLECRQWGAHLPHVAGIAGQSHHGAQSVALSGGYEDDEDNGEWFLYTGSGGRDLSGNKRTNKVHAFDQRFEKSNQALRLSCLKGYPVRVVRSEKERRSSYAPQAGVRYDGVYRIERCWRKKSKVVRKGGREGEGRGKGGRGEGEGRERGGGREESRGPYPSTAHTRSVPLSSAHTSPGRKLPQVAELKQAVDVTERTGPPAWDWIEEKQQWGWVRAPPACTKPIGGTSTAWRSAKRLAVGSTGEAVKKRRALAQKRLAKDFACLLCGGVLRDPVSTPCQHSFCLACLQQRFHGQADTRDRSKTAGRSLRAQKIVKQCPATRCTADIADVLSRLQHCPAAHCPAAHCPAAHCPAAHCPAAHCPAAHCPAAHCPAAHCPAAHCPAAHCPAAHCPAAHCPAAHCPAAILTCSPASSIAPLLKQPSSVLSVNSLCCTVAISCPLPHAPSCNRRILLTFPPWTPAWRQVNHDMADLIAMLLAETNAPDAEEGEDAGEGGEEDGEEGAEGEEDEADENNAEDEEKDSKGQAEGKEREGNIEGAGEEGVKEEGRSKGVQALDAIGAAGSTGGAGEGKGKGAQAEVDGGREGGVDGSKTGGVVGALSPTSGGVAGVTTASAPADAAAQGAAAKGMAAVGTAVERAETERAAAGKASAAAALVACSSLAGVPEGLQEVMRAHPDLDQATLRDMLAGEAGGDVEELRGMLRRMRCHQQQGDGAA
ncbi:unnamed protein product [Closterium sp. NIES-65]|nr:unnamed protein product [Closterium sp. NIES-65]